MLSLDKRPKCAFWRVCETRAFVFLFECVQIIEIFMAYPEFLGIFFNFGKPNPSFLFLLEKECKDVAGQPVWVYLFYMSSLLLRKTSIILELGHIILCCYTSCIHCSLLSGAQDFPQNFFLTSKLKKIYHKII